MSVEKRLNHAPFVDHHGTLFEKICMERTTNHFSIPFELCHDHFLTGESVGFRL